MNHVETVLSRLEDDEQGSMVACISDDTINACTEYRMILLSVLTSKTLLNQITKREMRDGGLTKTGMRQMEGRRERDKC